MAQMKAKEKEMKQEKEDARQVCRDICTGATGIVANMFVPCSNVSKPSETSGRRRKRRSATKSWPRRCIRSVSRD